VEAGAHSPPKHNLARFRSLLKWAIDTSIPSRQKAPRRAPFAVLLGRQVPKVSPSADRQGSRQTNLLTNYPIHFLLPFLDVCLVSYDC
jgi:hypothetical protein